MKKPLPRTQIVFPPCKMVISCAIVSIPFANPLMIVIFFLIRVGRICSIAFLPYILPFLEPTIATQGEFKSETLPIAYRARGGL